jgi:hypothetical protein
MPVVTVLAVRRPVVRADDDEARPTPAGQQPEEARHRGVYVGQCGGVTRRAVLGRAGQVVPVRLVQRGDVEESKERLVAGDGRGALRQLVELVPQRIRLGDTELRSPMILDKQIGEYAAERRPAVEEAHAAEAERVVALLGERGHHVGFVEDPGAVGGGLAAGEPGGEEPGVSPRRRGSWQEPGEERVVRRVGEAGRCVPPLPSTAGQDPRQVRRAAGGRALGGHVVAQGVERDEGDVVRADQGGQVGHATRSASAATWAS